MSKTTQEITNYKRKFNEENYNRVGVYMKEADKLALDAHLAITGESMNAFINRAIKETIQNDNSPQVLTIEDISEEEKERILGLLEHYKPFLQIGKGE
jgi:hypothetical protein